MGIVCNLRRNSALQSMEFQGGRTCIDDPTMDIDLVRTRIRGEFAVLRLVFGNVVSAGSIDASKDDIDGLHHLAVRGAHVVVYFLTPESNRLFRDCDVAADSLPRRAKALLPCAHSCLKRALIAYIR